MVLTRRLIACVCVMGVVALLSTSPEPAEAKSKVKQCNRIATINLLAAQRFITDNLPTLLHDFELNERSRKAMRIRARMRRKAPKLKFSCAKKVLCRDGQDNRAGFHGSGILGNKIRICWNRVVEQNKRFCDLAGLMTHEFGHAVGIPKERFSRHHREQDDKVYQFGFFARELCRVKGHDRELNEVKKPTPWPEPTTGLAIYPRKDYQGFSVTLNGSYPNLRSIGRNDAISSIKVKSGRWQLCTKSGYRGNCRVFTANTPELPKKYNDKVTSIRPAP